MNRLLIPIALLFIMGCSELTESSILPVPAAAVSLTYPSIDIIPVDLPLTLSHVDLKDKQNRLEIPTKEAIFIGGVVKDYYLNECQSDVKPSQAKLESTYLGTLWASHQDSLTSVFYVLLKHYPSGKLNGKVIFYDNLLGTAYARVINHRIDETYSLNNGQLIPSLSKKELLAHIPEIELLDFNNDGILDFKISQLSAKGTKKGIETQIFDISSGHLKSI